MTRKDFELIAGAIYSARVLNGRAHNEDGDYTNGIDTVIMYIADELSNEYPRFDKEKFIVYCMTGGYN